MVKDKIIPVKIGDKLSLSITKFGRNGDPMMVHEGFIIFLQNVGRSGVDVGRLVDIKITKVLDKFAFAEIDKDKTEGLFAESGGDE